MKGILIILFFSTTFSWAQKWTRIATAQGGEIETFTEYEGELFIAGGFRQIDSQKCVSFARWDGTTLARNWSNLGPIRAFSVYENELFALGKIDRGLVKWNGSRFESFDLLDAYGSALYSDGDTLYYGTENGTLKKYDKQNGVVDLATPEPEKEIRKIIKFKNELIVAGNFDNLGSLVVWRNNRWQDLDNLPFDDKHLWIEDLEVYRGELYAAGMFDGFGTGIMKWDGKVWEDVGNNVNARFQGYVNDMDVFKGELYLVFASVSRVSNSGLVKWNGNSWSDCGFRDTVGRFPNTLGVFKHRLVVGMYDYEVANIYIGEDRSQTDGVSIPSFSIYPNPAINRIHINFSETPTKYHNAVIAMSNANGKEFFREKWNESGIDISHLNSGLYFVSLFEENGAKSVSKLVVMR